MGYSFACSLGRLLSHTSERGRKEGRKEERERRKLPSRKGPNERKKEREDSFHSINRLYIFVIRVLFIAKCLLTYLPNYYYHRHHHHYYY